jgi:hypothetical protein
VRWRRARGTGRRRRRASGNAAAIGELKVLVDVVDGGELAGASWPTDVAAR